MKKHVLSLFEFENQNKEKPKPNQPNDKKKPSPAEQKKTQEEWAKKLMVVDNPKQMRDSGSVKYRTVEITNGEPDDETLIAFADGWNFSFGGEVRRYTQGSKKFADIKIYID